MGYSSIICNFWQLWAKYPIWRRAHNRLEHLKLPISAEVLAVYRNYLKHDHEAVRQVAAEGLLTAGFQEPEIIQLLLLNLSSKSNYIRYRALKRLENLTLPLSADVLAVYRNHLNHDNEEIRQAAAEGLLRAGLEEPEIIQVLLLNLSCKSNYIRSRAVNRLENLTLSFSEDILAIFRTHLKHDDEEVRQAVAEKLLGQSKRKAEIINIFIKNLSSQNYYIIFKAYKALVHLGLEQSKKVLAIFFPI